MSTPPGEPGADAPRLDQRLADLDTRARRRTVLTLVGVVVLVAVGVPLLQPALDGRHHRHHTGSASWPPVVAPIVVGLVAAGVVAWLVTRRRGVLAASPVAGLPRSSRRQVARTIRRGGPPSPDELTRVVETRTAERVVAQRSFGLAVFGLLFVLAVAQAVFATRTTAGTVFSSLAAALFAFFLVLQLVTVRGARCYLAAVSRSVASSG